MPEQAFDEYADQYDEWFFKNEKVLASEVALLAHVLEKPGRALSVGCGSGIFEAILKKQFGIAIQHGIEPAEPMAEIARKRGLQVRIGTAEEGDYGDQEYDTVLFNGTPSYIEDLGRAFRNAFGALRDGGAIVVVDVPKESSYAMLYNLAKEVGSWDHEYFAGAKPPNPYPIAFVQEARWRSTPEKVSLLEQAGFVDFSFAQTLTRHPAYSDDLVEEPVEGFDRGDYVAIRAIKPTP